MNPTYLQIVETMQSHGGNFIKKLAALWLAGDPVRKIEIEKFYKKDFLYYTEMWKLVQKHQEQPES
jgi:hypothetical protein